MIRQEWMTIVAGEELVTALTEETRARCQWTGRGYDSGQLCLLQQEQAGRGVVGAELVQSIHGWSVRYDSGLQEWRLLAGKRHLKTGSLEEAEEWARRWVAERPKVRYAWRRR